MSVEVLPYRIAVPDGDVDELHRRLRAVRFPVLLDATPGDGVEPDRMASLVERWISDYSWREQEAALNELAQFVTTIDGQLIHFAHVRSERADA